MALLREVSGDMRAEAMATLRYALDLLDRLGFDREAACVSHALELMRADDACANRGATG